MSMKSSMATTPHEEGGHTITVQVWFEPQPGTPTHLVDVMIEWPTGELELPPDNELYFEPAPPTFWSRLSGKVLWVGVEVPESPGIKDFEVRLLCKAGVSGTIAVGATVEYPADRTQSSRLAEVVVC